MKASDPEKKRGLSTARKNANSIYSWLVQKNMTCMRIDEHHTRREEGQQIMLLISEFWILAIIIWTLHPISCTFAQNAVRRFGLCVFIKLTTFLCRAFPPRCVCVENNFQIFQQPKTQHVYNLLLIKTSGNLNVLLSWKAFSLSQSCIYQRDKHPVQYCIS